MTEWHRRNRRAVSDINVVPYIDVMLVLLVIFMVTAPMMTPGVLDLPSVSKANTAQNLSPIEVNLQTDGSIQLRSDGQSQTIKKLDDLAATVQRLQNKGKQTAGEQARPVVIAADKTLRYEQVMDVMDRLQRAQVARVGLLVKTGSSSGSQPGSVQPLDSAKDNAKR